MRSYLPLCLLFCSVLIAQTAAPDQVGEIDEVDPQVLYVRHLPDVRLWYVTEPLINVEAWQGSYLEKIQVDFEFWNPNTFSISYTSLNALCLHIYPENNQSRSVYNSLIIYTEYGLLRGGEPSITIPSGLTHHTFENQYSHFDPPFEAGRYVAEVRQCGSEYREAFYDTPLNATFEFSGDKVTEFMGAEQPGEWSSPHHQNQSAPLPLGFRITNVSMYQYEVLTVSEIGFSFVTELWNPSPKETNNVFPSTTRPGGLLNYNSIDSPVYVLPIVQYGLGQAITVYTYQPGLTREINDFRTLVFNLNSTQLNTVLYPEYFYQDWDSGNNYGYAPPIKTFDLAVTITNNQISYQSEPVPNEWPMWDGEDYTFSRMSPSTFLEGDPLPRETSENLPQTSREAGLSFFGIYGIWIIFVFSRRKLWKYRT